MSRIAFVYSAIETPWPGMGRYVFEPTGVVADILDRAETVVRQRLGLSLRGLLAGDAPFPESLLSTINATTQIALTAAWQARGVHPSALVCRCAGEFAAAHASGAVDLADALEVPCRIARLIGGGSGRGRLLVVHVTCADATALRTECPVRYEVVSEANESSTVIGCAVSDAAAAKAFFARRNIRSGTSFMITAPHTWLVDGWKEDLLRPLAMPVQPARLPIHSATARGPLPPVQDWARHFWRVVRCDLSIRSAIGSALDDGIQSFVEIGGQPTLRAFIEGEAKARGLSVTCHATMERNRPLRATMDETLAALSRSQLAA